MRASAANTACTLARLRWPPKARGHTFNSEGAPGGGEDRHNSCGLRHVVCGERRLRNSGGFNLLSGRNATQVQLGLFFRGSEARNLVFWPEPPHETTGFLLGSFLVERDDPAEGLVPPSK
jgi:hypothetical protein